MLQKLLTKLGFLSKKESLKIRQANLALRHENDSLRAGLSIQRPLVDVDIGDPAPTNDPVARKEYVARVAAFHKDLLGPKIKSMVSDVREQLEKVENTPKMDELLKGTCNALWLLYEWGEQAVNEMISYQTENLSEERDILKETLSVK